MADILSTNWSETASDNTAAPPDGWPEGMARSAVNNAARELMGAIKRFINRACATRASVTTANDGSNLATAYQLDYTVPPPAYVQGQVFSFRADKACGAAPKLKVNALAQLSLFKATAGGVKALERGDIAQGQIVVCTYDTVAGGFIVTSMLAPAATGALPGDIRISASDTPGGGWLACDGRALSRTTYAALFAAIGTKYGPGDNATTFNIPDFRGRTLVGAEAMPGGTALPTNALRIGQGAPIPAGWAGGETAHVLTVAEMPAHAHGVTVNPSGLHQHSGATDAVGDHAHTGFTDAQGHHAHPAWTDVQGTHAHTLVVPGGVGVSAGGNNSFSGGTPTPAVTDSQGAHAHNVGMDAAGNHAHNIATHGAGAHAHNFTSGFAGTHDHSTAVQNTGGGAAHNNIQPSIAANVFIFSGVI